VVAKLETEDDLSRDHAPASLSLLLVSRGFLVILFQALNDVGGQISGQDSFNMAFVTTLEVARFAWNCAVGLA
jgi:hypothetical protein